VHSKVRVSFCVVMLFTLPLFTWLMPAVGNAQTFRLDHFRAAERPDDGFGVRRMGSYGHLRPGVLLSGDYAHDPLVIEGRGANDRELQRVVRHQLTLKLDLSLSLWNRAIVFAGFDVVPLLKGPSIPAGFPVPAAGGGGFGDVSLGARVRLLGEADDFFALGAQAALIVPTAGTQAYRGEDGVAVRPELIAELRPKPVRVTANLGFLVRPEQRVLNSRVGDELTWALGVGVPVIERLELIGELWGGFMLKDFASRTATPFEWLAGAKYHTTHGVYLSAAAGTGFTHGIGAPDARAVAQLGYLMPEKKKEQPVETDRDHDGILDAQDACPDQPEDRDGFADEDGCPDLDDDQDGIPDSSDACAREPEDRDAYADEDGCPDPDNDDDGILDRDDACPLEPGVPEERGCPAKTKVETEGELHVLDQIHFENAKAVILPESVPPLESVQSLLATHPEISVLRIEGHTDSVGQDAKNLALSRSRAAAVGSWLVAHGVDRKRLSAYGCGEQHPIADNTSPEGRAQNRRVVFQVAGTTTGQAVQEKAPAGCVETPID
jgi:outer membrane protein OmpA-like peptidoglycan-associated protein